MTVIRRGKRIHCKNLKRKMRIGFYIVMVVSVLIIGVLSHIRYYNKRESNKNMLEHIEAAVLINNCKGGEAIGKEDVVSVTLQMNKPINVCTVEDVIGKNLKYSVKKGTVLSESFLKEESTLEDDMRIQEYSCIEITERLKDGDFVDIRIHFSNGADYVILPKKRVISHKCANEMDQKSNSLSLEISEMDILLLSSAMVDAYYDEHSLIYAVQYVSDEQKTAFRTYPENDIVHNLIKESPNVVVRAEYVLSQRIRERVTTDLKDHGEKNGLKKTKEEKETAITDENFYSNDELDSYFID